MAATEQWPTSKEHYELLDVIGTGGTASVQIALCKPRNEKCAIKRIDLDKTEFSIEKVIEEVNVMSKFAHENIAQYYTAFVVKLELWVVMRLYGGGSVLDVMKHILKTEGKTGGGILDEVTIATILKEVLKGLEYVHSNQYIHRDVKASNILLGDDGSVVLTDFGGSGLIYDQSDRKQKTRRTFVGTPCWMAPEVMEQVVGYNEKADIWSFGITAIELAVGKAPYHNYPPMKILMMTLGRDPPTLDDCLEDGDNAKYSKPFKKIIEKCLVKDPAKRPSVAEIKKDPFFKKAKDRQWIIDHLVHKGLTTAKRGQKVKRVPGESGRLHQTATGWEWSDDDYDDRDAKPKPRESKPSSEEATEAPTGSPSTADPGNHQQLVITSLSFSAQQYQATLQEAWRNLALLEQKPDISTLTEKIKEILDNLSCELKITPEVVQKLWDINKSINELLKNTDKRLPAELLLKIRMRNNENRLNDICFGFTIGMDTPIQLAAELVNAGHINPKTANATSQSIQYIIDHYPVCKVTTFKLSEIGLSESEYDEAKLIGYAQLSAT
ncbi:hypothetical protein ACHWQZ_G017341 [Mnemiopsis leidyi]